MRDVSLRSVGAPMRLVWTGSHGWRFWFGNMLLLEWRWIFMVVFAILVEAVVLREERRVWGAGTVCC